jgi:uncharacterized protein (PEP-CTERM system associated)
MSNGKSAWVTGLLSASLPMLGLAYTLTAHAADWILAPGLTLEQVFTDNANLDDAEQFESISRISPRISAYREGARAKLDLRYAPEYRHYWHETETNKWVHFLRADGEMELYEDHLFVDGWASADQHTIDSGGRTGIDGLTGGNDLTEVYTGGISPYFTTRLGPYLAAEARYRLDRVYYEEVGQSSSTGQRLDLVLGSGPSVRALPWQLQLEESQVNYDDLDNNDRIRRARIQVNHQLNRKWALAGTLGYEDLELAVNSDQEGDIWNVGFLYTPNNRTRLAAGVGERFFGTDYYLDFTYRGKRVVWNAEYGRDVVSARDEVQEPGLFARQDEFGNLIRDPVLSAPLNTVRTGATLNEEYYLLDKFTTRFTFATQRTTLSLDAAYRKRDYEAGSPTDDTEDRDLAVSLNRTLRQRLSGLARLSWTDHEEEQNDYQQWIATLGTGYRLGQRTSLNLSLAHLDRNATVDANSYKENRISLALQASW